MLLSANKFIFEMSQPKKYIVYALIGFWLVTQNSLFAQNETEKKAELFIAKNAVFAEFAGNSGGYAMNYGRIIHQRNRMKLATSVGFSMFYRKGSEPIYSSYWVPVIPVEMTAFLGNSNHHLELGGGFFTLRNRTYSVNDNSPNNIQEQKHWDQNILARIGYRYQKPDGGFFLRVAYTPTIVFVNSDVTDDPVYFLPFSVGISLGVSF
ncbi:MAG: hypothetical protein ACK4SF_09940 [Algoriphagus aquaeductus]|uniref:hypothetical protein n=1 Tax=Algoriphagus aquaeductus TaxID=475299 RepID=UPI0039190E83